LPSGCAEKERKPEPMERTAKVDKVMLEQQACQDLYTLIEATKIRSDKARFKAALVERDRRIKDMNTIKGTNNG
jgi:uncharacterized membrane protein